MAKLMNWHMFERGLQKKGILLFSATDLSRLFGATRIAATFFLHRYFQRGYILRVKRGLYAFPDALPPEPFVANKIYAPSYVSLEFALSYHRVIPETVYEITSITTKTTRRFEAIGRIFSYRNVRREAFTGYRMEKQGGFSFLLADPDKALVDACFFRAREGRKPISRFDGAKVDSSKVLHYAELLGGARLTKIMRGILR